MQCVVCFNPRVEEYRLVSDIMYYECGTCGCLFADPSFLAEIERGLGKNYESSYWKEELRSARDRSFGSSLQRVAETFLYCRIPIDNFIDIGSGPGYLLDAATKIMPASSQMLHAIEMFPPIEEYRTNHPNYRIGSLDDVPFKCEAGTCIEVIEHLTPSMLRGLVRQLAKKSEVGSCFYFGSGQPRYVKQEDPAYLDPHIRGHIMSYSIDGLRKIFFDYGFNVIPLPGRDWAFLAEFGSPAMCTAEDLLTRIWTALPENVSHLKDPEFGPLMYTMGVESARCYLEHAISVERTSWAIGLEGQLKQILRTVEPGSCGL